MPKNTQTQIVYFVEIQYQTKAGNPGHRTAFIKATTEEQAEQRLYKRVKRNCMKIEGGSVMIA